jgi:hypothetical protein
MSDFMRQCLTIGVGVTFGLTCGAFGVIWGIWWPVWGIVMLCLTGWVMSDDVAQGS